MYLVLVSLGCDVEVHSYEERHMPVARTDVATRQAKSVEVYNSKACKQTFLARWEADALGPVHHSIPNNSGARDFVSKRRQSTSGVHLQKMNITQWLRSKGM